MGLTKRLHEGVRSGAVLEDQRHRIMKEDTLGEIYNTVDKIRVTLINGNQLSEDSPYVRNTRWLLHGVQGVEITLIRIVGRHQL